MDSIKNKKSIKGLMALGSVIFATIMICSLVLIAILGQKGIYDRRQESVCQEMFKQMDEIYSVMAMANRGNDYKEGLEDTSFIYGVLKADSLERVDLSKESNYIYQNFEKMPPADAGLDTNHYTISEYQVNANTIYEWQPTLFGYAYCISQGHSDEDTTYFVISQNKKMQDVVPTSNIMQGDLYQQTVAFLNFAYAWRYGLIGIAIGSFVVWALVTICLISMAGHKRRRVQYEVRENDVVKNKTKYEDYIEGGFLQKIPFDLATVLVIVLVSTLIALVVETLEYSDGNGGMILLAVLTILASYIIALIWICDLAVRIKLGKWWQNTLLYKLYKLAERLILKAIEFLAKNISLLWKAGILFGILSVVEGITILGTRAHVDTEIVAWFFYKVLQAAFFTWVILQANQLKQAAKKMAAGDLQADFSTEKMAWEFKTHGENLKQISEGMNVAIAQKMQSEHFKTELITNVSHDIKTPLTSIINYVDLLEKENIDNEKAKEYLEVLHRQSDRLKKLIEDLIEASKASTGNLPVSKEKMEMGVFLSQMLAEYEEKLQNANLSVVMHLPETESFAEADGRHLSRVLDNLLNNICKYAYPGTRVFVDLENHDGLCQISIKNTSKYQLDVQGEELLERFARGDASRHTEGSGLGLSIAQSLMELMGGQLHISIDGDLFKVMLVL